jgi:hypothetical protein
MLCPVEGLLVAHGVQVLEDRVVRERRIAVALQEVQFEFHSGERPPRAQPLLGQELRQRLSSGDQFPAKPREVPIRQRGTIHLVAH